MKQTNDMELEGFKAFLAKSHLRGSIMLSLLLQIILISTGNWRKRSSSKILILVLWLAYLSADWVATYSLGLISNKLGHLDHPYYNPDVLGFWTPFLLLHLGGPDTITAFSVEDSQLWLRHGFSLILQFIAVGYIFYRSIGGSKLLFPTLCVLVAGALKYGERTWALKKSSMNGLRESLIKERTPGPDYETVMDVLSSDLFAGKPGMLNVKKEFVESMVEEFSSTERGSSSIEHTAAPLDESMVEEFSYTERGSSSIEHTAASLLSEAYFFFQTFKQIFVDLILSFHDRDVSRSIFKNLQTSKAYKLIETELSFTYDILYTKALVVHNFKGRVLRVFSFILIIAAFTLFFFVDKHEFEYVDKVMSYALLGGALVLEIVSLGLFIFSDWTIIMLRKSSWNVQWLENGIFKIISQFRPSSKSRWSQSMGQCNFLRFCLNDRPTFFRKFLDYLGMKQMWDEYWYLEQTRDLENLKKFIYEDISEKSEQLEKNLNNSRGGQALGKEEDDSHQLKWSVEVDFDESLLLWHIATQICFYQDEAKHVNPYREASGVLSKYMLYLLNVHPFTLSAAGLGPIRYQDTLAEAKRFFNKTKQILNESEACMMLMNVNTYIPAREVKGDRSKSVLWDAVRLAREMKDLNEQLMWKIVCNVWIEMLCFAARHCRGYYHAQLLSVGGEFLSIVWLLEIHFGMGLHYQIKSGHFMTRYEKDD